MNHLCSVLVHNTRSTRGPRSKCAKNKLASCYTVEETQLAKQRPNLAKVPSLCHLYNTLRLLCTLRTQFRLHFSLKPTPAQEHPHFLPWLS